MSASKKKQQRKAAAAASEELFSAKKSTKKEESSAKYIIAGIMVAVVLVLSIVLLVFQGFVTPNAPAMTLGGDKVYTHEMNYYYINTYSNFVNQVGTEYAKSLFGLDTTQSLKAQTYYADESMSWHDYFLESAKKSAQQIHALSDAARAENMQLSADYESYVAQEMDGLRSYVAENDYSLDAYLKAMYGKRMTAEEYERLVRNGYLASQYQEERLKSIADSYAEADLESYYNANRKDFDLVTYRRYFVSANTGEALGDDELNAALASARATAETIADASTSEANFIAQVVVQKNRENAAAAATAEPDAEGNTVEPEEYTSADAETDTLQSNVTYSSFGSSESSIAQADWLFDDARTSGNVTTVDTATGTYVLFFMDRSRYDYNTIDVRHILVSFESFDADGNKLADDAEHEHSDDETITSAQNEAAKAEAERILDEWKSGAATEQSFAELAKQYTDDSNGDEGGLYEEVHQGQMVANFNDWCFGSGRKAGDTGIVSTDYGYHVMYFSGTNKPYWMVQVRDAMSNADYSNWLEAQLANYEMSDKSGMSSVGLANQ